MQCRKCRKAVKEGAKFCPECGEKDPGKAQCFSCVGCGTPLELTAKFCMECGKRVTRLCTCGAEIQPTSKFCEECGTRVSGSPSTKEHPQAEESDGSAKEGLLVESPQSQEDTELKDSDRDNENKQDGISVEDLGDQKDDRENILTDAAAPKTPTGENEAATGKTASSVLDEGETHGKETKSEKHSLSETKNEESNVKESGAGAEIAEQLGSTQSRNKSIPDSKGAGADGATEVFCASEKRYDSSGKQPEPSQLHDEADTEIPGTLGAPATEPQTPTEKHGAFSLHDGGKPFQHEAAEKETNETSTKGSGAPQNRDETNKDKSASALHAQKDGMNAEKPGPSEDRKSKGFAVEYGATVTIPQQVVSETLATEDAHKDKKEPEDNKQQELAKIKTILEKPGKSTTDIVPDNIHSPTGIKKTASKDTEEFEMVPSSDSEDEKFYEVDNAETTEPAPKKEESARRPGSDQFRERLDYGRSSSVGRGLPETSVQAPKGSSSDGGFPHREQTYTHPGKETTQVPYHQDLPDKTGQV